MQKQYRGNSSENGTFHATTRRSHYARIVASASREEREKERKQALEEKEHWSTFFKKADRIPSNYRKLLSRTAVCLVLALGILGIKAMDSQVAEQFTGEIASTVNEEQSEEELGRLQFVNGEGEFSYSLPLEGEVVESFAESERNVSIKSAEQAEVKSILAGTVVKTSADSVVINNANGTQTTYTGLIPGVLAGDTVESAQVIGALSEEVLCLETVSGIGYLDSLDAEQLEQASAQSES